MLRAVRHSIVAACLCAGLLPAAHAQITIPPGATIDVVGAMDLACVPLVVQGTVGINSGQIQAAAGVAIAPTGTVDGGSGTLGVSGNWSNNGTFFADGGTVVFSDGCASGPVTIAGTTTFNNLTLSSTSGRAFVLPAGSNITVNGTLLLQGASGLPIELVSASTQAAVITLGPHARVINQFATIGGNVRIAAASASVVEIPTLNPAVLLLLSVSLAGLALRHVKARAA